MGHVVRIVWTCCEMKCTECNLAFFQSNYVSTDMCLLVKGSSYTVIK